MQCKLILGYLSVYRTSEWLFIVKFFSLIAKEIRLRHGAPVIMVEVIDRMGRPLPAPLEVQHERAKAPDMTGGHQVVICSREQLKVLNSSCGGK